MGSMGQVLKSFIIVLLGQNFEKILTPALAIKVHSPDFIFSELINGYESEFAVHYNLVWHRVTLPPQESLGPMTRKSFTLGSHSSL